MTEQPYRISEDRLRLYLLGLERMAKKDQDAKLSHGVGPEITGVFSVRSLHAALAELDERRKADKKPDVT